MRIEKKMESFKKIKYLIFSPVEINLNFVFPHFERGFLIELPKFWMLCMNVDVYFKILDVDSFHTLRICIVANPRKITNIQY